MAITPTTHKVPALILGTANWGENATISSPEQAQLFLDILKRHNLRTIDTSRNYPAEGVFGTSEVLIGKVKAASQGFLIDSKVDNFTPGDLKYNNILASVEKELSALQADRVRVQYLHWPDRTVPLTETLRAMNEAYKQGKFDKFGISNYSVAEIEEIMEICEREDWIKPSVYQGHYNVLCRRGEKQLFPTLRKHGFSFYAWSPAAAGMASKNASMIDRKDTWASMVRNFYGDDKTNNIQHLAAQHGLSGYELCIRWILFHSLLDAGKDDAIVLGATRPEQLEDTLSSIVPRGPLDDVVVKKMEDIWTSFEKDAPSFSPWVGTDGWTLVR